MTDNETTTTDLVPVDTLDNLAEALAKIEDEVKQSTESTPEAQKKAMGLPLQKNTEFMGVFPSVWILRKRPQTALLTESGRETNGYMVLWRPDTNPPYQYFTTFIGAEVLCRDLKILTLPMKTRLVKSGRSWTFAEPEKALF